MKNTSLPRLALYIVGAIGIITIIGIVALSFASRPVDDVLKQVLSNSILGVVALLKTSSEETQPVLVTNPATDPVPVEPAE